MSKPIGYVAVLALTGVCLNAGASFTVPPIPRLPTGWEDETDTGFTPCIELSLERSYRRVCSYGPSEEMRKLMAQWGPGAVTILIDFYGDTRWTEYRPTIVRFIGGSDTDTARTWANAEMRRLLLKGKWTADECRVFRTFVFSFSGYLEADTERLGRDRLPAFAEVIHEDRKSPTEVEEVCTMLIRACPGECARILEDHAGGGMDKTRLVLIRQLMRLQPGPALEAAVALGDATTDMSVRRELCQIFRYGGQAARAQEPMNWVCASTPKTQGKPDDHD